MAKSKWNSIKNKLIQIQGWARDGLVDEQIAHNLGISKDTFYKYEREHPDFSDAVKKGKEVVDYEVENSLLKRALGYSYVETTKAIVDGAMTEVKRVVKEVPGDTTAQIFWLKNRKPEQWRDRKEIEHSGSMSMNNPFEGLATDDLKELIKDDQKEKQ